MSAEAGARTPSQGIHHVGHADNLPGQHGFLVNATIFRPITVLVLAVALVAVGWIAYPRLPIQLMPDDFSTASAGVWIPVPDYTPREVMEEIVKPTEDYLRTIPGIRKIISSSSARRASFRLEFAPESDINLMVAEVRDRLDRARASWPREVDRYNIWRQNTTDMPVYIAAVSMELDDPESVDLDYLFENVIQKRLEATDGVARVNIWGLIEKRVQISADMEKVEQHGIRLYDVVRRLSQDNVTVNAGSIREGDSELIVRVDGKFKTFAEVADYPATTQLRIADMAHEVGFARAVRDRLSRVNGYRSKVVAVYKESAENTVTVCQRITESIKDIEGLLERTVPGMKGIEIHAWLNQGRMIHYSLDSLKESGIYGAFFAVLVLYAFFRKVGMTLLVTAAIPCSLLVTVVWMYFRGMTFNMLSLMGLTLGVGMLVDNSIVVVENIVRHRQLGAPPRAAAVRGLREVAIAVALATLTTVIVFLPGTFITDPMVRSFFLEIGETVCASVLSSLLVALVFVPQGAIFVDRFFRRRRRSGAPAVQPASGETPASSINRACCVGVAWCLRHRVEALLLAFGIFGFGQLLLQRIPKNERPPEGPSRLQIGLKLPKNFTLSEADAAFAAVEKSLLDRKAELHLASVTSWFGATDGELQMFLEEGVRVKEKEFFDVIRPILPQLPGVTYRFGFEDFARNEGGQRVRVFVRGNDLDGLQRIGAVVKASLEDRELFPELSDVSEWREEQTEEIRVQVGRRLAQEYGTDTASISRAVAWALRGAVLPDFEADEREYPFWIRDGRDIKENIEELNAVRVGREGKRAVRLENLGGYAITPSSGEIHRENGKMTVAYSATVLGDPALVCSKLERHFSRIPLPDNFEISTRQVERSFEQDLANLAIATGLAMLLVFFVMGVLFESFILPLSVLLSIPHAFFGAIVLLWAMGVGLDMIALLGFLLLVGIVVNNAIVLVDCINRNRGDGLDRLEAILTAVRIRFRPIWMTALTTICGLLPLLLLPQKGEGVDYKPLATVIVGGLTTSTFFTLFIVPISYTLFDDLRLILVGLPRLDGGTLRRLALGKRAPTRVEAVDTAVTPDAPDSSGAASAPGGSAPSHDPAVLLENSPRDGLSFPV